MTKKSVYEVQVLVKNKPVFEYSHQGDSFIEGRSGSNYTIKICNNHYKRVKAVISVDGLSVLDGEIASIDGKGYVINAYSSIEIDGWRISDSTVKQFQFGAKGKSYSAKTGQGTNNVGVIGVVFRPEKQRPVYRHIINTMPVQTTPWWEGPNYWNHHVGGFNNSFEETKMTFSELPPVTKSISMNAIGMAASASAAAPTNNVGTAMGESKTSHSYSVEFEVDTAVSPVTAVIYYDDRKGLEARGIVVNPAHHKPDPFPASNGYCKIV